MRPTACLALLLISCAPGGIPAEEPDSTSAAVSAPDSGGAYRPIDLDREPYASMPHDGVDAVLLVRELFGDPEVRGGEEGRFVQETETSLTAIVTVRNLADDSVRDHRARVTLTRPSGSDRWRVVRAGEQFRCQSGRGQREWGAELCS